MSTKRTLATTLLALLATAAFLAPATPIAALEPPASTVAYGTWDGAFTAGLPVDVDDVNAARYGFATDACHRALTLTLAYDSEQSRPTPVGDVDIPAVFEAQVVDAATGVPVHDAPVSWESPGAASVTVPTAGAYAVDLALRQGVDVTFTLSVDGAPAADAACRWQGRLFVSEVESNPEGGDSGDEWVELYNAGDATVNLSGWRLDAHHGTPERLVLPEGTFLAAGERLVIPFEGRFLDNAGEVVTLTAPDGWLVDATPALSDSGNDARTWQRVPDALESWAFATGTPGAPNAA